MNSPGSMCLNPLIIKNPRKDFDTRFDSKLLQVPCNHCYECINSRCYDLEIRAVAEMKALFDKSGQVWNYTLTYDEKHLPKYCGVPVLCRRDMQLFIKRLKKRLGSLGQSLRVQYCGEYGKKKDRPHWHILIYSNIIIDAQKMYDIVRLAWSISKRCYDKKSKTFYYSYTPLGFVGLPTKWQDGHILPHNPIHALINNQYAIKYCVKYCFKSYNFEAYLYKRFKDFLTNEMGYNSGDDISTFEFPDDDRFTFSKEKDHDINYIVRFFSKCFRNPNNFGISQLNYLNEDYLMFTDLRDNKNDYITYPISRYLKNKLFHINCVDSDKSTLNSRYTKKWLNYMQSTLKDVINTNANFYICNQNVKLQYNDKYKFVKDALNDVINLAGCDLSSILLYRFLYLNKNFLSALDVQSALTALQSRSNVYVCSVPDSVYRFNDIVNQIGDILLPIYQELKYNNYLNGCQKFNERQHLIAYEHYMKGLPYKLRLLNILPFDKFINLKKLSINEIKNTY